MSKFGHILKASRGNDKYVPMAYDGMVHLNIELLQGPCSQTSWPSERGGDLLDMAYVFSDLHKKACFKCSQLEHLGQYSRAYTGPLTERGPVWSFLDVLARNSVWSAGGRGCCD